MDLGIGGKRALVIGGSTGLGRASAAALAAEGVNLAIFARNPANLQVAVTEISVKYPVTCTGFAGDITKQNEVAALRAWAYPRA